MNATLSAAIDRLRAVRPVFHSEADFQFALAWQCKMQNPSSQLRLELPVAAAGKNYKLDLLLLENGRRIGIELKYLKAGIELEWQGEWFRLKNQGAQDIGRYDILKDVVRLEAMVGAGAIDEGYAITLTNDRKYWQERTSGQRVDESFGIHHGRLLNGELRWADHAGGTMKGREAPLCFGCAYSLEWKDYAELPGYLAGKFRMLCISIK